MTVVLLVHPGGMGAAVGRQAVLGGATVRWFSSGRSEATRRRALDFGFEDFTDGVPELFAGTTLEVVVLPGGIGQAPALKMAYASYQKISSALAAVAHALDRECGVSESLVREAELLRSFPLAETAQFPGVANHSGRRGVT
jgi:hypothetical protein